jgi:general secretion pathway protein M
MNVRDWLANLSSRERQLVYGAAGLVGVVLLYLVLLLPFQSASHRIAARLEKKTADLAFIRQAAPRLSAAKGRSVVNSNESLVVLVDRTAREAGLGGALRDQSPNGQGVRLRMEGATFDAMVAWLGTLQNQYGVAIEAAMVDGVSPGVVNASLTLTRPSG